jgi:hypothetical protein
MRTTGAFELHVEQETETRPMRVSVCLHGAEPDDGGVVHMTPDCLTLDALEGCINALQDELDALRAEARRAFTGGVGHA